MRDCEDYGPGHAARIETQHVRIEGDDIARGHRDGAAATIVIAGTLHAAPLMMVRLLVWPVSGATSPDGVKSSFTLFRPSFWSEGTRRVGRGRRTATGKRSEADAC